MEGREVPGQLADLMALGAEVVGRTYPASTPHQVSTATIRDFAAAIGADAGGEVASPTYPIVVAFPCMQRFLDDPEVGIALHHVIHGGQRFEHHRPVRAGDVLSASLHVQSVRSIGGADVITTRTEITTLEGEQVCTAHSTLVHREPDPG